MKSKVFIAGGIILFCVLGLIVFLKPHSVSASYANGYTYSRSISIVAAQVSSTQTNFPMLVSGAYSWLAASSSGGLVQNGSGDDIIFTSDSSGNTKLNWEVESYTSSTGNIVAWVKIPTLTSSTQIYMFYDNSAINTFQGNATGTWNSNYLAVYHFPGSSGSPTYNDSTANAYNGGNNNAPTVATGTIDGAAGMNGTTQNIYTPTQLLTGTSDVSGTWSMWANSSAFNGGTLAYQDGGGHNAFSFSFPSASGQPAILNLGNNTALNSTKTNFATSTWYYYTVTWNQPSSTAAIYINGALDTTFSGSNYPQGVGASPTIFGSYAFGGNTYPGGNYFQGSLDETRVLGAALSSSWILTEYNNQSSPATFYTFGSQNSYGIVGGTLSCTITTSTCASPSVAVLYLASTTNSHASLTSSTAFGVAVCCSGVGSLGNSCNGVGATSTFLHLASTTNAHVEENTQNNYPSSSYACLSVGTGGSISVGYVTSTSCEVAGFNTELVSIASTTNSHVAKPGSSTFQAGSTIQVCASASTPPPSVSNVVLNGGSSIILTPNATTSVTLSYTVSDYNTNGCSDVFNYGGVTSTAFLDTVSSTCENSPTANNLNCYVTTLAGSTNSCGGTTSTSATATDTLNIYYLARSSGVPSSSYPSDHWYGYVSVKTQGGVTSTAISSAVDVNALSALSLSNSSIAFGSVKPNTNTGSVNQYIIVSNVGNTSNTPELSGTVFIHGSNSFATSSEHYASSTFTFGGSEQSMNTTPTIIPGVTLTAPTTTVGGYSNGYTYTRAITVTSTTSFASGTQTNFPMLFSGTYSWLEASSSGGRIQNLTTAPNGAQEPADLTFATSPTNCGVSNLNFETESYTSSTGNIIDWVNVPSLAAGTVIYACYGATSITSDQSHPSATWNSQFLAVVHFPTPTSTIYSGDSTGNHSASNNGITSNTSSQIGSGASANGSSYVSYGNITAPQYFTNSSWVNFSSLNSNADAAGFTVDNDQTTNGFRIWCLTGSGDFSFAAGAYSSYYANASACTLNTWYNVAETFDGTTLTGYINGVAVATTTTPGAGYTFGASVPLNAFYQPTAGYNYFLTGKGDELELQNVAESPSWILTEYNNQKSPSNFYTVGSEVVGGSSNNPSATIYFGLQVPFAVASGTYTATDTFTGLFSN